VHADERRDEQRRAGAELFGERLWPSVGVWLMIPLVAGIAVVAFTPIGVAVGVSVGLLIAAVLLAIAVYTTPKVAVRDGELVAGKAHVPVGLVGEVTVARGEDARIQRGPALDARAFLLIRGWVDPLVRVELRDPQDPTPYWLVSTRRPEELARALGAARAPQ
jgi:hypothetical protein